MRRFHRSAPIVTLALLTWTAPAGAQAPQAAEPAPADAAAPADAPAAQTDAPVAPTASPPPGEEVMRPTEHGIRLTPQMARAMTRMMASGMNREYRLTPEQQERLSEAYARRLMQTARANEEHGQAFVEYALESLWRQGHKLTPEAAREFGARAMPVMPAFRGLFEGLLQDAEPILEPEAMNRLRTEFQQPLRALDRFDEKMQRWSRGEVTENENLFSGLEDPVTQPAAGESQAANPTTPEVRQAERIADWTLSSTGVAEWSVFLAQVKEQFKLDEQQSARADQILAGYQAKAEAIMTPDWKEAVRQNRIKINLRNQLKDVPTIPWMWRLQHEYDQAIKPIRELGWAFRKDVLAVLTGEQREGAMAAIATPAGDHGLPLEDKDRAVLGMGAGTWSLWRF